MDRKERTFHPILKAIAIAFPKYDRFLSVENCFSAYKNNILKSKINLMQYLKLTRIRVIQAQVEIALTRTTYLSKKAIDSLLEEIEKQRLNQVYIYGLDSENMCSAQLIIEIDWYEHNLQNCNGNRTVVIAADSPIWIDNTVIELHEALSLFNDYVFENSLKAKCQISYGLVVNREDANHILGMVNAESIRWKDKGPGFEFEISEIKELRVGFYCLE